MELLVDNQPVAVESLGFHYQDAPFTGGHLYLLKLDDASLANEIKRRYGSYVMNPSRQDAETILGMLNSVISFRRLARPGTPIVFFVNSVSSMEIVNGVVVCCGECSRVG